MLSEIDANNIIGGSFTLKISDDPKVFAVLNQEYSHLISATTSTIAPGDCRFV